MKKKLKLLLCDGLIISGCTITTLAVTQYHRDEAFLFFMQAIFGISLAFVGLAKSETVDRG